MHAIYQHYFHFEMRLNIFGFVTLILQNSYNLNIKSEIVEIWLDMTVS